MFIKDLYVEGKYGAAFECSTDVIDTRGIVTYVMKYKGWAYHLHSPYQAISFLVSLTTRGIEGADKHITLWSELPHFLIAVHILLFVRSFLPILLSHHHFL